MIISIKMTKKLLFFAGLLLISFGAFAQNENEIKVYAGTSKAFIQRQIPWFGEGSIEASNFWELGIGYSRTLVGNLGVSSGLNFSRSDILIKPAPGVEIPTRDEKFEMLTIPLLFEYTFFKYGFLAAGPLLDFQLTENNFSDQSGIGYLLGPGGEYETGNLSFSLFPNLKRHSAITFNGTENSKYILTELGLQLGVGL
jgi:hypothetical protein